MQARKRRTQSESGVALAVALLAIVIVGGMVGGAFFLGFQEQRIGASSLNLQEAFAAAEGGAQWQLANWKPSTYNALSVGDSVALGDNWLPGDAGWYRGSIRRMSDEIYLLRSEGFSRDSLARRHIGALVRLVPMDINIQAALKTQGATKLGGSSYIDGDDAIPAGWSDCNLNASLPGLITTDSTQITTSGCSSLSCLNGSPKLEVDTSITADSLTNFGDLDFYELAGFATNPYTAGVTLTGLAPALNVDGSCNENAPSNWGEPTVPGHPCADYFPIIHFEAADTANACSTYTTRLTGGYGQGILIVDGNLKVEGGFEFYGPVVVRCTLETGGTGGHFQGGVIAANVELDQNTILGNALINYSSCALERALNNAAPVTQLNERSWVNLD